jgi:hypothetical protein
MVIDPKFRILPITDWSTFTVSIFDKFILKVLLAINPVLIMILRFVITNSERAL